MRIGVAGITTSGKSTLAEELSKQFNGKHYCVDDFYYTENFPMMTFKGKRIIDWETPECIHWDKFEEYIDNSHDDLAFIDSYLLFYSKKVSESLDALIVIEYGQEDFQVALERRIKRYFNCEVPSDYMEHPDKDETNWEAAYFTEYAWKFAMDYPEYREPKVWTKPILRLKAVNPLQDNIEAAKDFVAKLIKA